MAGDVQVWSDGNGDWERVTDEPDLHGVDVSRASHPDWSVFVAVMEFVRQEPLESELRRRIAAALLSVDGVETAVECDREVWWATGTPLGESLVRAVGTVLNDLDGQLREAYGEPAP